MDKENSLNLASLLDFTHLSIHIWICIISLYNRHNILVFILISNPLK